MDVQADFSSAFFAASSQHSFAECSASATLLSVGMLALFCLILFTRHLKNKSNYVLKSLEREKEELLVQIAQQHLQVSNCAQRMQTIINDTHTELIQAQSKTSWEEQKEVIASQSSTLKAVTDKLMAFDLQRFVNRSNTCEVDTAIVLEQCERLFTSFCKANNQTFIMQTSTDATVQLPQGLLEKLINRLVTFSIQHSRKDEPVIVNASSDDKGFYLSIEDFGQGIPFERLKTITLNASISSPVIDLDRYINGTDLLTLQDITNLCSQFGGSFELVSAVNYATRSYLYFPSHRSGLEAAQSNSESHVHRVSFDKQESLNSGTNTNEIITTSSAQESVTSVGASHVMVLASDRSIALNLKQSLGINLSCDSYLDISAAIEGYVNSAPQALVIEHGFSGLSAAEVLNLLTRIKSDEEYQPPTSLVLLNSHDTASKLNLLRDGFSAVVQSPFNFDEITLVLRNLLKESMGSSMLVEETNAVYQLTRDHKADFMSRFNEILNSQYTDPDFCRDSVANMMFIETRTLSRKLNEYSGMSFGEHLKTLRLQRAKLAILSGAQVSDTCFEVGFNNLSHFSTAFKKHFGSAPSKLTALSHVR
jgi:AraC-like DNA-binding protein